MSNKYILVLLFLFLAIGTYCQEKDFQVWSEFGIKKEFNKDFSISLDEEFRFNENTTIFDKWHSTLGIEYDIIKHVTVSLGYRYTQNKDLGDEVFKVGHRAMADLILHDRIKKRFRVSYRLRYQRDYEKDYTGRNLYLESAALRNKVAVKYNIRKNPLSPFASYEFLYRLNNPYGNSIERNRFTVGCDYKIIKNMSAELFYRYQTSSGNHVDAKNYYILGIGLDYKF